MLNRLVLETDGDKVVSVNVRMRSSTAQALRVESARRQLTISDLIAEALAQRPVNPIRLDDEADAALRALAGAEADT